VVQPARSSTLLNFSPKSIQLSKLRNFIFLFFFNHTQQCVYIYATRALIYNIRCVAYSGDGYGCPGQKKYGLAFQQRSHKWLQTHKLLFVQFFCFRCCICSWLTSPATRSISWATIGTGASFKIKEILSCL